MIVVADTSPLNYLLRIGYEHLLPKLYKTIIIPNAVHRELLASQAPPEVRLWAESLPIWVSVQRPKQPARKFLVELDAGETEALQLALELQADLTLIDERRAFMVARDLSMKVTGTLGVLRAGHTARLCDAQAALASLRQTTNFRLSLGVEDMFLRSLN